MDDPVFRSEQVKEQSRFGSHEFSFGHVKIELFITHLDITLETLC